jgi:UDP-N-acetylmuramate dehydrogenase
MDLSKVLKDISDLEIELDRDLANKSTMRLRARGDLVTIKSKESLSKVLVALNKNSIPYKILGWGSNQILKPSSDKIYLELDFPFDKTLLSKPSETYVLPASTPLNVLTAHAIKFGLKGFESFTGIPASLGGAVFMNAGTGLGEIGTIVRSVKIMEPSGRERLEKITQELKCNILERQGWTVKQLNNVNGSDLPRRSNFRMPERGVTALDQIPQITIGQIHEKS